MGAEEGLQIQPGGVIGRRELLGSYLKGVELMKGRW